MAKGLGGLRLPKAEKQMFKAGWRDEKNAPSMKGSSVHKVTDGHLRNVQSGKAGPLPSSKEMSSLIRESGRAQLKRYVLQQGYMTGTTLAFGLVKAYMSGRCCAYLKRQMHDLPWTTGEVLFAGGVRYALDMFVQSSGAGSMPLALVASSLSKSAVSAIRAYWRGEIDDADCFCRFADATLKAGGAAAGFALGEMLGTAMVSALGLGPVAPAVPVIAGFIGYMAGSAATNRFSEWLFGEPEDDPVEALRRAYEYFGLDEDSTDGDVRRAYLHRCRDLHPDRNRGQEGEMTREFQRMQAMYELIRASREEEE